MSAFAFNSIRFRLIANTVLVCGTALFLAFASLLGIELVSGRRALVNEIGTIATIVGNNAAGAVTFDDDAYARTLLGGLTVRTDIIRARIHKRDGTILATYERPAAPESDFAEDAVARDIDLFALPFGDAAFVEVERPIVLYGDNIGTIRIRADLSRMAAKVKLYALVAGIGVLLLFLASIFVSWRLHQSIYKDITDLVGAMAEIAGKGRYDIRARKSRNDELGYLVDGFNAMLERLESRDEELREAMVQAEAANRAKSSFLAAVSHELRTPLNAIIGFSEIMVHKLHGPLGNEKYAEYIVDINGSGQHLLQLINDILDLSKIESGKDEVWEEDVDVAQLVDEAVKLVRDSAWRARIEVLIDLPEELPLLRADPRKVKQILLNLLSNAVKFTPAGGLIVQKVRCESNGGLVFQTADSGIGIAPEDIPKAMSVFGQVDDELSRKYGGTGLGLPLSAALAQQHGGALDVRSAPGQGTTATVRFPPERSVQRIDAAAGPAARDVINS